MSGSDKKIYDLNSCKKTLFCVIGWPTLSDIKH